MLEIGSLVDNKYKVLNVIGRGGMSVVYLAINERANKTWAIKEVRKDGVVDFESVRQGLVVETDMLKRLNHPHLPSIIDVIDKDDSFLIVMDYVEGKSLQSMVKHGGAQPQDQVVEWGKQLCDVLGYLHNQNPPIIYRDMKPANVMLKPDGNITLIDFGTAREFKNRAMVEDTTCLGTRGYAAPEQFGGRGQTDARTDIYCTGATLYHLLTGHSPAEPPYEIKPLSYWDPNFAGTGLEKVIAKCCQQDPNARYQSCSELMYALEHVKDEDDAVKKSRRAKWNGFLACVIIFLVGVAGMITFKLLAKKASEETYTAYVRTALENLSDQTVATKNIERAIMIDPGRAEAYQALYQMIIHDSVMDQQEKSILDMCMDDSQDGVRNFDVLKEDNPKEYAETLYQMGMLYAFLFTNQEDPRAEERASLCFKEVETSPYLDGNEQQLAKCMALICRYNSAGNIGESGNAFVDVGQVGSKFSVPELWDKLEETVSASEGIGAKISRFAVYKRVSAMINFHMKDFYDSGVSANRVEQVLNTMQAYMDQNDVVDTTASVEKLRLDTLSNIQDARAFFEKTYKK